MSLDYRLTRERILSPESCPLICCHRGKAGGSVVENTIPAFQKALELGADIVEVDVERTADGVLVAWHDDTIDRLTGRPGRIREVSFETLRPLPLRIQYGEFSSGAHIHTLDEILEEFKGKCMLNLDKCWKDWEQVETTVLRHGIQDQIIFKCPAALTDRMDWMRERDYLFMPMLKTTPLDVVLDYDREKKLHLMEYHIKTEDSPYFTPEFAEKMHRRGIKLWVNALSLGDHYNGCAYMDDHLSITQGPDLGWGRLLEGGVDILQTDWPFELRRYLRESGRRAD